LQSSGCRIAAVIQVNAGVGPVSREDKADSIEVPRAVEFYGFVKGNCTFRDFV